MADFFKLTKMGIIIYVILGGLIGFGLSFPPHATIEFEALFLLIAGLYFLSAGTFAINQAQEKHIDEKMPRTKIRPIPRGKITPLGAYIMGALFVTIGFIALFAITPLTAYIGLLTVILYNGFYTLYWKKKWAFAAVPGAIPGALPIVIGFSVNSSHIFSPHCVYAFMIMFLWQMPHFWSLAIHFKEDYRLGGIPVLPVALGVEKTLYHIGLYTFVYLALAIASPWFVKANVFYLLLVVPLVFKVFYEFVKYYAADAQKYWLRFFMWTNLSMLIFLASPLLDRWIYLYMM
ncbi:MAG: protoheme IX farnesyltransferase [Bdellovibrionales bacterium]|nr:protoheme IX farnesyltransferase [Bdellovibrionales bacterium]